MDDKKPSLAVAMSVQRQQRTQTSDKPRTPLEGDQPKSGRPFSFKNPKLIADEILAKKKPQPVPEDQADLEEIDELVDWEDALDGDLDAHEDEPELDRKDLLKQIMQKMQSK